MSPVSAGGVQGALQIQMMKVANQQAQVAAQVVTDAMQATRQMQAAAAPGTGQRVDIRV